MPYDEDTADRVRQVLEGRRDVVEKKLMGGLCFMVKGVMCCSISGKGGILVRVDEPSYEKALDEPYVEAVAMGKRVMRGFVRVLPSGYRTYAALSRWVGRGVERALAISKNPVSTTRKTVSKPRKP